MTPAHALLAAALHARSAAYDIVLLAHVLAALVALVVVAVAGGSAVSLGRSGPSTDALRRYYRPGTNWAGRVLFLVPVLGVALVAMSQGRLVVRRPVGRWSGWSSGSARRSSAEIALWPAERRLRAGVERGDRVERSRDRLPPQRAGASLAICAVAGRRRRW